LRNTVIARRYAKALFELALERKVLDTIVAEMDSFEAALSSTPGFRHFLNSQDMSKNVFQDRGSNIFFNFLLVLLRKNRESTFSDIAREFHVLVDNHNKRTRASATTAVPLDKKSVEKLRTVLGDAFKLDIQLDNDVDESILGGIVVNVNGQLLDGSLRSQLDRLRSELSDNRN